MFGYDEIILVNLFSSEVIVYIGLYVYITKRD